MLVRRLVVSCLMALLAAASVAQDSSQIAERYKQMLEKNPVAGPALERLWKMAQHDFATGRLLDEYKAASDKFSGAMIYGHLLRRTGRSEAAREAYQGAAQIDEKSALPHLALASLFFE